MGKFNTMTARGFLSSLGYTSKEFLSLLEMQSLTQFLKSIDLSFSVDLTFLGNSNIFQEEIELLCRAGFSTEYKIFSREVFLLLDEVKVVRARSICSASSQFWINFLDCHQQSLGEKLFSAEPELIRSPFYYTLLNHNHVFIRDCSTENLITRYSIFSMDHDPLLLTESFLPHLLNKIKSE